MDQPNGGVATGRPEMPPGYGIHTEAAGTLPWSWARDQLTRARNYWLCTTRPDGRPHVTPVWGLWLDAAVLFSTDPHSRKGRNLAANPAAVVHLESGDEVVVVDGRVEPVRDADVLARFCTDYAAKYAFRPELNAETAGCYALRPAVVLGWRERDFPATATRWALRPAGSASSPP
jgi:PPOX class probable F420-dependent enzyme